MGKECNNSINTTCSAYYLQVSCAVVFSPLAVVVAAANMLQKTWSYLQASTGPPSPCHIIRKTFCALWKLLWPLAVGTRLCKSMSILLSKDSAHSSTGIANPSSAAGTLRRGWGNAKCRMHFTHIVYLHTTYSSNSNSTELRDRGTYRRRASFVGGVMVAAATQDSTQEWCYLSIGPWGR